MSEECAVGVGTYGEETLGSKRQHRCHSLHVVDTELSADSVEWCPLPGHETLLACGTYQISKPTEEGTSEAPVQRVGRVLLYQVDEKKGCIVEVHRQDSAAILDMKWCHKLITGAPTLCTADARGEIRLHHLQTAEPQGVDLQPGTALSIGDNRLALSLDYNSTESHSLCVSDSLGSLSLLHLDDSTSLKLLSQWKGHEFEAWVSAFNTWNPNIVYSGGDDSRFCGWDTRTDCKTPIFCQRHDAGVCCIQSNPHWDNVLATGSYDEQVRLWDPRHVTRPLVSLATGGGVWRLKWHPSTPGLLLSACMHGGFRVLHCTPPQHGRGGGSSSPLLRVLCSYEHHGSLAYGADWSLIQPAPTPFTAGASSLVNITSSSTSSNATPSLGDTSSTTAQSLVNTSSSAAPLRSKSKGNLTIRFESSTGFIDILDDDDDDDNDGGCGVSDGDGAGAGNKFHLVATCSFYDHALHVWSCEV